MTSSRGFALLSVLGILCLCVAPARAESARAVVVDADLGLGFDSNPTLAPRDPYFDQRTMTTVDPERRPSLVFPVRLRGSFRPAGGDRSFLARYEARGVFFGEANASNADQVFARVEPGFEWLLGGDGSRRNALRITPFVAYKKEQYFDRDSGDDFEIDAASVADRYTYLSSGAGVEYDRRSAKRVEYSIEVSYENRNYDDVSGISSLDQQRVRAGGQVEIELRDRLNLYLDYDYTTLDYDERHSRSVDGRALLTNPAREYRYHDFGATLRSRLASHWTLYADYDHRLRRDEFEGYHDYDKDEFGLRLLFRGERWRGRIAPSFQTRSHDRAFAFDLPQDPRDGSRNPHLSYDTVEVKVGAERLLRGSLWLTVDLRYADVDAKDPRYSYVREETVAGIHWRPRR